MRPVKKITIDEANEIIQNTIQFDIRHPDYARTVERAAFYYQILTGLDQEHFIVSYKPRESIEQKKQRIHITNTATKEVAARVRSTFKLTKRTDNITKFLGYPESGKELELSQVQERVNDYNKGRSVGAYLNERFEYLTFFDPNSFIVTLFEATEDGDGVSKKPYSFPKEFSSSQAINYQYDNGVLSWLIGQHKKTISYTSPRMNAKAETKEGVKYFFYGPQFAIVYDEIHPKQATPEDENGQPMQTVELTTGNETRLFTVELFPMQETTAKNPAIMVGYIPDELTNGRTYVSPLDCAENIFKDLINQKSEFDLTRALHTFLQKIGYAPRCEFQDESAGHCLNGYMSVNDSVCPSCKGTGLNVHKTTQDVIYIALPEDKDGFLPLSEFVHYVELPEWLPKWQDERIDKTEGKVFTTIFNKGLLERATGTITATEKRIELESVYNVLSEYGDKYSEVYKHIVELIAIYAENNTGLLVAHKFPKDFKLETLTELIERRKAAIESQAPDEVVRRIDNDIVRKQNLDNPDFLRMVQAKEKFKPFKDKISEETIFIIAGLPASDYSVILWKFFDEIFLNIQETANAPFYILPFEIQNKLIQDEVGKIRERLEADQITAIPSREALAGGDVAPTSLEAEAKAKLRGTVGGVTGIININKAVTTGDMTKGAAVSILIEIYGFSEEVANELIEIPDVREKAEKALAERGIIDEV
jgi:hypothetical protein